MINQTIVVKYIRYCSTTWVIWMLNNALDREFWEKYKINLLGKVFDCQLRLCISMKTKANKIVVAWELDGNRLIFSTKSKQGKTYLSICLNRPSVSAIKKCIMLWNTILLTRSLYSFAQLITKCISFKSVLSNHFLSLSIHQYMHGTEQNRFN